MLGSSLAQMGYDLLGLKDVVFAATTVVASCSGGSCDGGCSGGCQTCQPGRSNPTVFEHDATTTVF